MAEVNPYTFPGLVELMRSSFASIIDKPKGAKVLILDSEMSRVMSLVCTHSWLLENEVLLTTSLDDVLVSGNCDANLRHLRALYVVSGSVDVVNRICSHLRCGDFKEYYIIFSNRVGSEYLELLARNDIYELVRGVYEYMVDVHVLSDWLFSLHVGGCNEIFLGCDVMQSSILSRIADGLYSVCCLCRQVPSIIYPKSSAVSHAVSMRLQAILNTESIHTGPILQCYNEYDKANMPRSGSCCCLILDRSSDLITPLLNQWSYEAMIHELIGLDGNKVSIQETEYIMSGLYDDFYREHVYSEFADVEDALQKFTASLKRANATTSASASNSNGADANLLQLLEKVPKSGVLISNATKHTNVLSALSEAIQNGKLLETGLLEQEMACGIKTGADAMDQLSIHLSDPAIPTFEKQRLASLYALTYGKSSARAKTLLDHLKMNKLEWMQPLVQHLFSKANATEPNLISLAKSALGKGMMAHSSPYMQHRSRLHGVLDALLKGRLDSSDFGLVPSVQGEESIESILSRRPASVICFVVGGATYAEARDCHALSSESGIPILLGGTDVVNARQFLADLAPDIKCQA